MQEKHYISWEQFYEDSKKLSEKIKSMNLNIKGIVCVTRGGLAPTAVVSSKLNIRKIEIFAIKTYSDSFVQNNNHEILSLPTEAIKDKGKDWIIIDELVDTGDTANYILKELPLAKLFVLYTKTPEHGGISAYIKEFNKDTWLCFPWD